MTKKQREITALCRAIRHSFADASVVYTMGCCYGFYKILKEVYPTAKAVNVTYEDESRPSHVVAEINGTYYDVNGIYFDETSSFEECSERSHDAWDANISGYRTEWIMHKTYKSKTEE